MSSLGGRLWEVGFDHDGSNFSSLGYGTFRDPCASADAAFSKSQVKVTFEKKNQVLSPIEKFPFLVVEGIRSCYNTNFSLRYLASGRLREVTGGWTLKVVAYKRFK